MRYFSVGGSKRTVCNNAFTALSLINLFGCLYGMLKNRCCYFTKYFLCITAVCHQHHRYLPSDVLNDTHLYCSCLSRLKKGINLFWKFRKVVLQSVPEALSVKPCDYMTDIVLAVRKSFISLPGRRESDRYLPAVSVSYLHGLQHWFPARLSIY